MNRIGRARAGRAGLTRHLVRAAAAAASLLVGIGGASALPVVITAPFTANPGDFITLQGSGFGSSPRVFLTPANGPQTEIPITQGSDNSIVVRIPKDIELNAYTLKVYDDASSWSAGTPLNAPVVHHFGSPDLGPGLPNRVYGRNLNPPGGAPSVTLVDTLTNAQLPTTLNSFQQYFIAFTPPATIVPGRVYKAIVSNGYAATTTEATATGHAAGNDVFKIDQAWGFEYVTRDAPGYRNGAPDGNPADHHFFDVRTDPALPILAKGDGVTNDAPAIQAAIDLANQNGGGLVYLPPGTYNLGVQSLGLRSGVVLQGHSREDTRIIYGPTTPQGASFSGAGLAVVNNGVLTGIADLSIRNVDRTSQKVINFGVRGGSVSKFFIQRVDWDLGSGWSITLAGDRIAVLNSTFTQSINHLGGDEMTGGVGPFTIKPASNLSFRNNSVKWATNQNLIDESFNAVIENNHFTRSASDTIVATAEHTSWPAVGKSIAVGDVVSRRLGRQLTMQFGKNVVVYGNIFDVSDGDIKINWNDGETFLNEARGRDDIGVVTSAGPTSISADSKCSGACSWNLHPNAVAFVTSGAGAGQWRRIISRTNNTFTIETPWDVVPSANDHFSIAVPSFENAIINANLMSGNPTGIALFSGTFLNVVVANNRLTDNAGIYLDPKSTANAYVPNTLMLNTSKNIEIKNNLLTNTKGATPAYLHVGVTMVSPTSIFGTSLYGVEVRSNKITARAGTTPYMFPEGFQNIVYYQNSGTFSDSGIPAIIGTVFQGNACVNCPTVFATGGGVQDMVAWNTSVTASPGAASTFLVDNAIARASNLKSQGTVVGRD